VADQSIPALPAGYDFHHIGYASRSLERELAQFAMLGYTLEGESFVDPEQGIAGCFMTGPGPRIELLENLPGSDTLTPWLNTGIKMYHFAYWVDDMERVYRSPANSPAILFLGPVLS
jgi:methylmalonyl-CoA/ethylmalonyl-CoA epimerase